MNMACESPRHKWPAVLTAKRMKEHIGCVGARSQNGVEVYGVQMSTI